MMAPGGDPQAIYPRSTSETMPRGEAPPMLPNGSPLAPPPPQRPQGTPQVLKLQDLQQKSVPELNVMADSFGLVDLGALRKHELIFEIMRANGRLNGTLHGQGVLEILPDGFGFLRSPYYNYLPCPEDIYVSPSQIRRFAVRTGDLVEGEIRSPKEKERFFALIKVDRINEGDPDKSKSKVPFENLTPLFPDRRFLLEREPSEVSMRVMDLFTPIGQGQRGLIVAPPRTGKTTLLRDMALGVLENNPECHVMILLVDERPEEVTDFRRSVPAAEIWASSNDEQIENHIRIGELCIERAKRLVEAGRDVVLFVDSITRLSRAHNTARNSGRTGSGGLDVRALEKPRQLFATARRTEEAGSLTIIASVLVETGSRMDDVIFQEFKGTGNMELVLDRKCAEMRLWPAINIGASGTRKEELLIDAKTLEGIHFFRRALVAQKIEEATETMNARLSKTKTNAEFLKLIAR